MIVLDTHVLLWWAGASPSRISDRVLGIIEEELHKGSVRVSSISAWEIAMLVRKGRLSLAVSAGEWVDTAAAIDGLSFVPVTNGVAVDSLDLPGDFHDDPADRIIVALARQLSAPLVTADARIKRYAHVETIW
jgi:PIN domain nuclease of toxin-antitoxin system